jgi:hypothetical protein
MLVVENYQAKTIVEAMVVPEYQRLEKALDVLPEVLGTTLTMTEIASKTGLSLTELRFGGWEDIHNKLVSAKHSNDPQ